jgi:hypothetical protein
MGAKLKITPAMRRWLKQIARQPNGELHWPKPNYDIAGRMEDLGLVEIINAPGAVGWPWGTKWHLRITEVGRNA